MHRLGVLHLSVLQREQQLLQAVGTVLQQYGLNTCWIRCAVCNATKTTRTKPALHDTSCVHTSSIVVYEYAVITVRLGLSGTVWKLHNKIHCSPPQQRCILKRWKDAMHCLPRSQEAGLINHVNSAWKFPGSAYHDWGDNCFGVRADVLELVNHHSPHNLRRH